MGYFGVISWDFGMIFIVNWLIQRFEIDIPIQALISKLIKQERWNSRNLHQKQCDSDWEVSSWTCITNQRLYLQLRNRVPKIFQLSFATPNGCETRVLRFRHLGNLNPKRNQNQLRRSKHIGGAQLR